jgi:hypothetical protein
LALPCPYTAETLLNPATISTFTTPTTFTRNTVIYLNIRNLYADLTLQPLDWFPHGFLLQCMDGVEIASKQVAGNQPYNDGW